MRKQKRLWPAIENGLYAAITTLAFSSVLAVVMSRIGEELIHELDMGLLLQVMRM